MARSTTQWSSSAGDAQGRDAREELSPHARVMPRRTECGSSDIAEMPRLSPCSVIAVTHRRWPETFRSHQPKRKPGLPVIVPDLGALPERSSLRGKANRVHGMALSAARFGFARKPLAGRLPLGPAGSGRQSAPELRAHLGGELHASQCRGTLSPAPQASKGKRPAERLRGSDIARRKEPSGDPVLLCPGARFATAARRVRHDHDGQPLACASRWGAPEVSGTVDGVVKPRLRCI